MWDGHLGTVAATHHRIENLHSKPCRASHLARAAEKEELDKVLAQALIEPATSIDEIPKRPRGVFRVLEKIVANLENGSVPVFQNALLESFMAVLRNGPGSFRRSFCPFSKTTPTRFCGRSGRYIERPPPVLAVFMVV
jgi:hypothetical protein